MPQPAWPARRRRADTGCGSGWLCRTAIRPSAGHKRSAVGPRPRPRFRPERWHRPAVFGRRDRSPGQQARQQSTSRRRSGSCPPPYRGKMVQPGGSTPAPTSCGTYGASLADPSLVHCGSRSIDLTSRHGPLGAHQGGGGSASARHRHGGGGAFDRRVFPPGPLALTCKKNVPVNPTAAASSPLNQQPGRNGADSAAQGVDRAPADRGVAQLQPFCSRPRDLAWEESPAAIPFAQLAYLGGKDGPSPGVPCQRPGRSTDQARSAGHLLGAEPATLLPDPQPRGCPPPARAAGRSDRTAATGRSGRHKGFWHGGDRQ